ncbi:orotidine-5'-phosphate decarboxylase [Paenibacillus antarcticus]|uniref:Orotidine 5'-phosphate decarboxylase n=1 Tax=Paenibacillus antarcticus TaxID=253703 RepID=A0A168PBK7_9BACL|nr:orotidine-5'-phosphate decarboxylase [Paenibacillus antarcticus]OAB46604.1 orotidine 5'-phosphate decarboxylase [Paenibacillus antarcticus]
MNIEYKNMAGRLIVALDYPDATQASDLVEQLQGIPCYLKVGMQLFYAAGPDFVRDLKAKGYSVFLDLKMHDIPNTVKGGAESITRLGVDMFNVHAAGGTQMMQAAYEGMNNALASDTSLSKPIIIAVTQLTSTSQSVLNEQIGVQGNIEDAVVRYAKLAASAGLDGVVASAQEVPSIGAACGRDFITVTPGIRPTGSQIGDQSRVLTPGEAIQQGSHYIVVGRPITAASNPREIAEQIIEEMMNVE